MADIKVEGAPKQPIPPKRANTGIQKNAPEITIQQKRSDAINGLWQIAGLGCVFMRQYSDAGAISMHGPIITKEVVDLADTNEQIAKSIDQLLQVGPYAGLVTAVLPLAMQILVNHKRIPVEKLPAESGIVDPEILEAQVKTEMLRMQLEALKAQREMEKEVEAMRAEYEAMTNDDTE